MSDWNEEVSRYKAAKAMPADRQRPAPGKSKKKVDKPFAVKWKNGGFGSIAELLGDGRAMGRFKTLDEAKRYRDKLRRACLFISPRWTDEQAAEQRKRAERWASEYIVVDSEGRVIE